MFILLAPIVQLLIELFLRMYDNHVGLNALGKTMFGRRVIAFFYFFNKRLNCSER